MREITEEAIVSEVPDWLGAYLAIFCTQIDIRTSLPASATQIHDGIVATKAKLAWDGFSLVPEWE